MPQLESTNEKVLMGIAEHLKLVTYNEDKYIVEEGKPLGKMFFITQALHGPTKPMAQLEQSSIPNG